MDYFCSGSANKRKSSYIDTSTIAVCHKKRISRNKVFSHLAEISKSTYGWFFGFKLHLVINEIGEIQALTLTKGNVDDRKPLPILTKRLTDFCLEIRAI